MTPTAFSLYGIDAEVIAKLLVPVLVAIAGALLKRRLEGRARLVTYLVHSASNPLPLPPQQAPAAVHPQRLRRLAEWIGWVPAGETPAPNLATFPRAVNTHAIVVRNVGKKTAHSVRIGHAFFPPSYNIFPPVSHTLQWFHQSAEIIIPVLAPGEQITVSYLYFPPLLWSQVVGHVKCDEGLAEGVSAIPNAPLSKQARWSIGMLAFAGASILLYWALAALWRLAQFFSQ